MQITLLNKYIEPVIVEKIKHLVDSVDIKEPFTWNGEYTFIVEEQDKVVALCVYTIATFEGRQYPRFVHIIYDETWCKNGKKRVLFLLKIEQLLIDKGHNQIVTYIKPDKKFMRSYATKFGFKEWCQDDGGIWYYKNLRRN